MAFLDPGNVPSLPDELYGLVFAYLAPSDVVRLAPTCRTFHELATEGAAWQRRLDDAVQLAVHLTVSGNGNAEGLDERALVERVASRLPAPADARLAFFLALPRLPTAVVAAVAEAAPVTRCLLSIDCRVFDASSFASDHPGGWENMMQYSGKDATKMFDVFAHSRHAHELMQTRLLRFDAVAYAGRPGAPRFAIAGSAGSSPSSSLAGAVGFFHDAWAAATGTAAEARGVVETWYETWRVRLRLWAWGEGRPPGVVEV